MSWKPKAKQHKDAYEDYIHQNNNYHHNEQQGKSYNSRYHDHHNNNYYHNHHNTNNYNHYNNNHHNDQYYHHRNQNTYNTYNNQNRNKFQAHRPHPANTKLYAPNISRDNKHVKYVRNTGKWHIEEIPSNQLVDILQSIWNNYYHKNAALIQKVILLCGAPGSGKTSVSNFVEGYYNLNTSNKPYDHLIDVSSIISMVIKENNGKIIMHNVYEKFLRQIAQNVNQNRILIIDGFLRKEQHVYVVNCLKLFMKHTIFIFLVMDVDEETSVKRQLERGQKLLQLSKNSKEQKQQQKKQRLKDSDLSPTAARKRYQKYNRLLGAVRYQLKRETNVAYDIIDANKSLQNVLQNVQTQLKKQDS